MCINIKPGAMIGLVKALIELRGIPIKTVRMKGLIRKEIMTQM